MDRKLAPKGQVAVQTSLQEWTEMEASGGKCETSIKILTNSYSAAPRKCIISFILSSFVHLVCLHEVAYSGSYRPHPCTATLQLHNWGVWVASTSEVGTTSQQGTRILLFQYWWQNIKTFHYNNREISDSRQIFPIHVHVIIWEFDWSITKFSLLWLTFSKFTHQTPRESAQIVHPMWHSSVSNGRHAAISQFHV